MFGSINDLRSILDCLIPVREMNSDVFVQLQDRLPFGRLASKPKQYIEGNA